jgi:hypothetical protein
MTMSNTVAWIALIVAGLLDVAWAVSMKYAEGYTRLGWTILSLIVLGLFVADDRTYLVRLVAAVTGIAQPDAERRVDQVIAQAKENISRARRTGIILGFMVGAAALLGTAAAWYVACAAGRHRDGRETLHPLWDWGRPASW